MDKTAGAASAVTDSAVTMKKAKSSTIPQIMMKVRVMPILQEVKAQKERFTKLVVMEPYQWIKTQLNKKQMLKLPNTKTTTPEPKIKWMACRCLPRNSSKPVKWKTF